jgi:hypothetical protein
MPGVAEQNHKKRVRVASLQAEIWNWKTIWIWSKNTNHCTKNSLVLFVFVCVCVCMHTHACTCLCKMDSTVCYVCMFNKNILLVIFLHSLCNTVQLLWFLSYLDLPWKRMHRLIFLFAHDSAGQHQCLLVEKNKLDPVYWHLFFPWARQQYKHIHWITFV